MRASESDGVGAGECSESLVSMESQNQLDRNEIGNHEYEDEPLTITMDRQAKLDGTKKHPIPTNCRAKQEIRRRRINESNYEEELDVTTKGYFSI